MGTINNMDYINSSYTTNKKGEYMTNKKLLIPVNSRSFGKFIGYLSNGINLKEAEEICLRTLGGGSWQIIEWYIEPNPKRRFHRPQLELALAHCQKNGASLIVPKMQHLISNQVFIYRCLETERETKSFQVLGCDVMGSEPMQLQLLVNIAQTKADKTSAKVRTKMQELKAQGIKLGSPKLSEARLKAKAAVGQYAQDRADGLLATVLEIKKDGNKSLQDIADQLNRRKIPTARGGTWHPTSVRNLLKLQERKK